MNQSPSHVQRSRYHEWCTLRCLRHRDAITPLAERHSCAEVAACVVASIALVEMGARSRFELWAERMVLRVGIVAARAGLLPGVPDISVGPFQIRPSTAFGWKRQSLPFGHVAAPESGVDRACLKRCDELLEASTAMASFVALLAMPSGQGATCESLMATYSRYRGRGLSMSEPDYAVLLGVHRALHAQLACGRPPDDDSDWGLYRKLPTSDDTPHLFTLKQGNASRTAWMPVTSNVP